MSIIVQEMGLSNTHYSMESSDSIGLDFLTDTSELDQLDSDLDSAFNAVAGLESLTQVEGVPGPVLLVAAENMLAHMGYHESLNLPSMESEADTTYGMEGIGEIIKKIWRGIKKAASNVIRVIRNLFTKMFGVTARYVKVFEELSSELSKLKGKASTVKEIEVVDPVAFENDGDIGRDNIATPSGNGTVNLNAIIKLTDLTSDLVGNENLKEHVKVHIDILNALQDVAAPLPDSATFVDSLKVIKTIDTYSEQLRTLLMLRFGVTDTTIVKTMYRGEEVIIINSDMVLGDFHFQLFYTMAPLKIYYPVASSTVKSSERYGIGVLPVDELIVVCDKLTGLAKACDTVDLTKDLPDLNTEMAKSVEKIIELDNKSFATSYNFKVLMRVATVTYYIKASRALVNNNLRVLKAHRSYMVDVIKTLK